MQMIYYLIIIMFTILFGVPLYILLNRDRKLFWFPLSALYGGGSVILIGYWLSYFGLGFNIGAFIYLTADIILWIYILLKRRNELKILLTTDKIQMPVIVACIAAGVLSLLPMLVYKGSFPYGDLYTYVCIADFLKENGYNSQIDLDVYKPWLSQMYLYQECDFRIGAQMFLAFWTGLFRRTFSIELYAPVSGCGVFLIGCSVWECIQHYFKADKKGALYGVVLCAFNAPIIVWSSIFGFFPQLFGLVFTVVALVYILSVFNEDKFTWKNIFLSSFFVSVAALCYSEIIPFYVLSVLAIVIYKVINEKRITAVIKKGFAVGIISFLLLGSYFINMIRAILTQMGAVVGGEQTINWWGYIGYLLSAVPIGFNYKIDNFGIRPKVLYTLITFFIIMLLIIGISNIIRTGKNKYIIEFLLLSAGYGIMLVYFTSIAENPFGEGIGNSWGIYKLVQYYFVVFGPFFSYAIMKCFFKSKKAEVLGYVLLAVFALFSAKNVLQYSYEVTTPMREIVGDDVNPIGEYYALYEEYANEEKVINLVDVRAENRKMATYFLRDCKLISDWSSDSYFGIMGGAEKDPLFEPEGIILTTDVTSSNRIANLVRKDDGMISIKALDGVGGKESSGDNESWTWNQQLSRYLVTNYTDNEEITIKFSVSAAVGNDESILKVTCNGKLYDKIELTATDKKEILIKLNVTNGGSAEIELEYSGDFMKENGVNGRNLYLCIWNMTSE